MKIKTPVTVGTYDDAGMICDADGNELFSVGQNEDAHEMFPNQAELAEEVMTCINNYGALQMHADKLQIQLTQKQHVIDRQTKLLQVGTLFRYHLNYLLNGRMSYSEVKEAEKQARAYLEENPCPSRRSLPPHLREIMNQDEAKQILAALEESEGVVENEYESDWRHGISTREKQLARMRKGVELHKQAIAIMRREVEPISDAEPPCNPHPDAPHGFSRNSSHSQGRYVCECEGWVPDNISDEELDRMWHLATLKALKEEHGEAHHFFARAIEAHHGIKGETL